MDVGNWLRGLGLGQYETTFRENEVDAEVLPTLTSEDLRELGVTAVGHRRKLLTAIEGLARSPPPAVDSLEPTLLTDRAVPEASAERRYLTVMFCDLVGSTSIAARLDAEEWRDLVNAYLDAASAAVTDMGGHVAKKLGDGLLVLFGYPIAHENDAERAARAALTIQRGLSELNRKNAAAGKPLLTARIGLDAGPIVVDAMGEIFGDTPNVAARVQAQAEPETILITARVLRHVAGLFVVEDRGGHELKGVPEPQTLFRLIRASGGGRRVGQRQLTPIVGRDEEMAVLIRRWERARQGEGQLVTIVGEPGLGKSRLIEELHARLREIPHSWVEWSCSQLLQNTPLHPIAEWGRQRFGDLAPERRLADLAATLAQIKLDPAENVPLLAPLLDIPLPKERASSLAPEELRRRQLAALVAWLLAGARVQPIVLAVEDLHWADPTTLDLFRAAAERGAQAPILVVATARPEFRPPWEMRSHHGVISLAPLDGAEVRAMVAELSARHALPSGLAEDVAARTGGVPLFVEELTRLLLEQGAHGGHAIPPTLQQSLTARLDRLGPAREAAQIASVIGRGFSYETLRVVAQMEEPVLQAALERLAEADILLVQGAPPQSDYRFKHALIQDAAYENLLKSRRQALHRRIAETLRDHFAAAGEPEVLAHHFTQAGLSDEAIDWWGKAGDQALRRSAFQEAIAHLGKAIEMADKASGEAKSKIGKSNSNDRSGLQASYAKAVAYTRGFASNEARAAYDRLRDSAGQSAVLYQRQWIAHYLRGELRLASAAAEARLGDALRHGSQELVADARRALGQISFSLGNFAEARELLRQALDECDHDMQSTFREWGPVAASYLAATAWHLGEIEHARALMDEATRMGAMSRDVVAVAGVEVIRCLLDVTRGDASAALSDASRLIELSKEYGLALYSTVGEMFAAWARAKREDPKIGAITFGGSIARYFASGNRLIAPQLKYLLAELHADAQDFESALAEIDEAFAIAGQTENRDADVALYRLRGEILLKQDAVNAAPAEEALQTALVIAEQQGARSLGLRAALSLAKFYQSSARAADANAVLVPALEGFSPMSEFPEIAQAQSLLVELAGNDQVKADAARRQRRLELATGYSQAVMWAKGFTTEDAKTAAERVTNLVGQAETVDERLVAFHAQWTQMFIGGDLRAARELANAFSRRAEDEKQAFAAATAKRRLGFACYLQGDLFEAKVQLERVASAPIQERNQDARHAFFVNDQIVATAWLALVNWPLGDADRARSLLSRAIVAAEEAGHPPTTAFVLMAEQMHECNRAEPLAALHAAERLIRHSQQYGIATALAQGEIYANWARGRLSDPESGIIDLRRSLAAYFEAGSRVGAPYFHGLVADLLLRAQRVEEALAEIETGLSISRETGARLTDSFLYRLRGDLLLKRNRTDTGPIEEMYRTAIDVAKQRGARSDELLASLSLAKLHQSTARPAEAHALLALALEGFSPTPEMPEIAEARAFLLTLKGR